MTNANSKQSPLTATAPRLKLFDTTMLVMGGIIGSGIFINPAIVARAVDTPALILAAWAMGGLIAYLGAYIYAELAVHRPAVGGQYAYLREAFHPALAFVYGWTMLIVIQTGGMAAVAITFARYFIELTGLHLYDWVVAAIALALLTIINCLGLRAGSALQSLLMVLKIIAISALIICGLLIPTPIVTTAARDTQSTSTMFAFATAMVPVLFAYGGWQTASFVAGEIDEPRKNLPRALLIGVGGVVLLYLAVSYVCLRALGTQALAQSTAPATDVMRLALGANGARLIAVAIAISTLGYLSQSMLTAPRVYFAMATDRLFFKSVARLSPRHNVPAIAIILQGAMASVIAISGRYEQILNYVVSTDFIFFGLTGLCIFFFRKRANEDNTSIGYRMPGHPFTTIFFVLACWIVVINTIYQYPGNSLIGIILMLAGIPIYFYWQWQKRNEE